MYCYTPSDRYLETVKATQPTEADFVPPAAVSDSRSVISSFGVDIDANVNEQECHVIELVRENLRGFSDQEVNQARRARALYYMCGAPTVENFKHLLQANMIQDCPITVDDVKIAEKIFGPDMEH